MQISTGLAPKCSQGPHEHVGETPVQIRPIDLIFDFGVPSRSRLVEVGKTLWPRWWTANQGCPSSESATPYKKIGPVKNSVFSPSGADFCVDLIAMLHFDQKNRVMALSAMFLVFNFGAPSRSRLVEIGKTL